MYTLREKKKGTSHQTNKGPWLRPFPYAAKGLHDFIVNEIYDGDAERAAARDKLFSKAISTKVYLWFIKTYPEVVAYFDENYGPRKLYPNLVCSRFRFQHVSYHKDKKIDGPRSREYRDCVPVRPKER